MTNPFDSIQQKRAHKQVITRKPNPAYSKTQKTLKSQLTERKTRIVTDQSSSGRRNEFTDRRIGEKVAALSSEDRNFLRFAQQRKKNKKSLPFALDDSNLALLNDKNHSLLGPQSFGDLDHNSQDGQSPLDEQEPTGPSLDDLDARFTSAMSALTFGRDQTRQAPDEYDAITRQLADSRKAKISDRLKSELEIQWEQDKARSLLENDRLKRMIGHDELVPSDDENLCASDHESVASDEEASSEEADEEVDGSVSDEESEGSNDEEEEESEKETTEFGSLVNFVLSSSERLASLPSVKVKLLELAQTSPAETEEFFEKEFFAKYNENVDERGLGLMRVAVTIFPLTDFQHRVLIPMQMLLASWADDLAKLLATTLTTTPSQATTTSTTLTTTAATTEEELSRGLKYMGLLYCMTAPSGKYCGSFFELGRQLIASKEAEIAKTARELVRRMVTQLPRDGLLAVHGDMVEERGRLWPLRMQHFKPMEVPALEPVFFSSVRGREDPEVAERKRLKRELAGEKRDAKRHLIRDAQVTQALAVEKKRKFDQVLEGNAKKERRMLEMANEEFRKLATTNLKREVKKHKKGRMAGNQVEK